MKWEREKRSMAERQLSGLVSVSLHFPSSSLLQFFKLAAVESNPAATRSGPSRVTSNAAEVRHATRVFSRMISREQAIETVTQRILYEEYKLLLSLE